MGLLQNYLFQFSQKVFRVKPESEVVGMENLIGEEVGMMGRKGRAVDDGQSVFLCKDLQFFDGFLKAAHGSILCTERLLIISAPDGGDIDDGLIGIDRLDLLEKAFCTAKKDLLAFKDRPIVCAVSNRDEIGLEGERFIENFLVENLGADGLIEDFRVQCL